MRVSQGWMCNVCGFIAETRIEAIDICSSEVFDVFMRDCRPHQNLLFSSKILFRNIHPKFIAAHVLYLLVEIIRKKKTIITAESINGN